MSLAVGGVSPLKKMALEENEEIAEEVGFPVRVAEVSEVEEKLNRHESESHTTDEEEEDELEEGKPTIVLGPQFTLKEQLEKDKEDESLRRWKHQLLGGFDLLSLEENLEPEVKILSISILSPGRPELFLPMPSLPNSKVEKFTLKEGSINQQKFSFLVSKNIVCGLTYINTLWKTGLKVESKRIMLGTFSPRQEPYTFVTAEETVPAGIFARGCYSGRTKFIDDDNKCYLDISFTFEIRKEWASSS